MADRVQAQDTVDVQPHDGEVALLGDEAEAGDLHRVAEPDADGRHHPHATVLGGALIQVRRTGTSDDRGKILGVTRIQRRRLAPGLRRPRDARAGDKDEEEDGEEVVLAAGGLHG